jgi:hypothetical protein
MSEQPPEQAKEKEPLLVEKTEQAKEPMLVEKYEQGEPLLLEKHEQAIPLMVDKHETEWIPGAQLELIRIPQPTIWPATLALGITGIAFGVVTHWILSAAGLFLFLLGAKGWIEDLKKDVL